MSHETLITNAQIVTVDPDFSITNSLLIRDKIIRAIGSQNEVEKKENEKDEKGENGDNGEKITYHFLCSSYSDKCKLNLRCELFQNEYGIKNVNNTDRVKKGDKGENDEKGDKGDKGDVVDGAVI